MANANNKFTKSGAANVIPLGFMAVNALPGKVRILLTEQGQMNSMSILMPRDEALRLASDLLRAALQ